MPPQASEPIINRCPECEQEIDVSELSPFAKIICPHCGETIRVRTSLGPFHLTKLLGEGGMSQVFMAIDSTLNREVALKVLHQSLTRDPTLTAMFEREAKLTASINHSNVVRVFTVGEDQGYFFIAMELVDNVSLEEKISGQGSVPESEVLEIAYDVSLGLRAAFQAGLIHRDIKPGNVLLTREGSAKLVDFGLALAHGGEDEVEDIWATPFYVPPEKLDGEPDDFRGDIYSLGAALFHAVAGRPPFEANTASMAELKEIKAKTLHLRDAAPHASPKLARLIDKMMAYKPAARHQSYDELVDDIGKLLDAAPGGGGRGGGRKVADRQRSNRATARMAAIGIPVGVVALATLVYFGMPRNDDAQISTPLVPGGEERVLDGGASSATQFRAAREALVAGKFESAHTQFAKLLESADLKEPTRSWTRFNTGLSLLLRGQEKEARKVFAELGGREGFQENEESEELIAFFEKIGNLAMEPLPVLPEAMETFDTMSVDCVGLLVCGLKNWNSSEFDSGAKFLVRFSEATPPERYSWITDYQVLLAPYFADLEILKELPRPERDMTPEQLGEMQESLTLSISALKTEGAAPELARSRMERAKHFLAEPPQKPPVTRLADGTPPADDPAMDDTPPVAENGDDPELVTIELELVEQIASGAEPLLSQYQFADAGARWDAGPFKTEKVRNVVEAERAACEGAEVFLSELTKWLAGNQYDGVVLRREGVPLDAKITAAEREAVIVDLGFGGNRVEVAELKPEWLLDLGMKNLMIGEEANVNAKPEVWAGAAWFARLHGLSDKAEVIAGDVSGISDSFRKHWQVLASVDQPATE